MVKKRITLSLVEKAPAETPVVLPARAIEWSENAKLGGMSATYAAQGSCPRTCPYLGDGCYAETGPIGYTTARLNRAAVQDPLTVARTEAAQIDSLTGDHILRLHVVGDCRTNAAARIVGAAVKRYSRRGMVPLHGKKAFGYSHAWETVQRAAWGPDVAMLASVESASAALAAMARGYAAAIVVPSFRQESAYRDGALTMLPCPNQTKDATCRSCGLCRDDDRLRAAGIVIAFEAHGSRAGRIRSLLRDQDARGAYARQAEEV